MKESLDRKERQDLRKTALNTQTHITAERGVADVFSTDPKSVVTVSNAILVSYIIGILHGTTSSLIAEVETY